MAELESSLTAIDWLPRLTVGVAHLNATSRSITGLDGEFAGADSDGDCEGACPGTQVVSRDGKPAYSYANLITFAINSSPQKRMTLSEIYQWICEKYPYYKEAGSGWKNSIRHNLSLNKCFQKIARSREEPGKGAYWSFDASAVEDQIPARMKSKSRPTDRSTPYKVELCASPAEQFTAQQLVNERTNNITTINSPLTDPTQFIQPPPAHQHHITPRQQQQQVTPATVTPGGVHPVSRSTAYPHMTAAFVDSSPVFDDLSESFKCLYKSVFESTAHAAAPENNSLDLSSLDWVKENVRMAGSYNWNNVDLTQFPALMESMRSLDQSQWSLNRDQFLDLASSLTDFFTQTGVVKTEYDDEFLMDHQQQQQQQQQAGGGHNEALGLPQHCFQLPSPASYIMTDDQSLSSPGGYAQSCQNSSTSCTMDSMLQQQSPQSVLSPPSYLQHCGTTPPAAAAAAANRLCADDIDDDFNWDRLL